MTSTPWLTAERPEWLERVRTWLAEVDAPPRAIESVKERPWGAVLRVETGDRTRFFKAMGPVGRHESRLLADIAGVHRSLAPDVLAIDHERGWVLMPDHGVDMTRRTAIDQVALVEALLGPYAELQRTTADLVPGWLAAGVPDRSPRQLPDLLAKRAHPYADAVDAFVAVCDELDGPVAIDHADIHGTNVLVDGDRPRLVDWGDACITHPCTSLLVPIEWVVTLLPAADRRAAVARLCDAYLEPWGGRFDTRTAALATWTGYVTRALLNDEQGTEGDEQDEASVLLRAWHEKRLLLDRPDELLQPAMRW